MSDLYYASAAEASSGLGLPLLLTASPSAAVPRHGERLSDFAPDVFEGSRLFHRLSLERDVASPAIWVTGPNATTEYVVWAVGFAEHAARDGMAAYLIDLDPAHPLRSLAPGEGHPLPRPVLDRIRRLGVAGAAAWATDLQGVRLVLPADEQVEGTSGPEAARSILIFAQALPEEGEGIAIPAGAIEGVCFAAAIRDHTKDELRDAVEWLRRSGHKLLGFIAMGPTPLNRRSPLDRWERVAAQPAPAALQETAPITSRSSSIELEEPAPVEQPAPASAQPQAVDAAPAGVAEPEILTPLEPPVSLVADWHRGDRKRPRAWLLALLGIVVALAFLAVWLRSTGRTPAGVLSELRMSVGKTISPRGSAPGQGAGGASGTQGMSEVSPANPETIEGGGEAILAKGASGIGGATDGGTSDLRPVIEASPPDSGSSSRIPEAWEQLSPSELRASSEPSISAPESGAAGEPAGAGSPREGSISTTVLDVTPTGWADTFVVHVSSFRIPKDAESEVSRLLAAGVPARILTVVLPERGRWHRVIVGAYPDSASAVEEAGALRARGLVSFTQTLRATGRGGDRAPIPR